MRSNTVSSFINLPWHPLGNPNITSAFSRKRGTTCTMGAFLGGNNPFPNEDEVMALLGIKDSLGENQAAYREIHLILEANDAGKLALARLHLSRLLRLL